MQRFIVFFIGALLTLSVYAQTKRITGTVNGDDGMPIPAASVIVEGSNVATKTDADGNFTLSVNPNAILLISFVGYEKYRLPVGAATSYNVVLKASNNDLDEVVVTALGITREKKSLGYASQSITPEQLNKTRVGNVASGLSGKVSGLQINQGNGIGGSTNVVIRGVKSLSANNQALFVVDGVPIDNTNNNDSDQQTGRGGYDYGNPAADINPDDIESVNVLKGAAASALYGSRAANGVIMITTKKAKRGLGIMLNSATVVGKIDPKTFVKYQKEYGAGRSEPYDMDGFLYFDANGDGQKELVVPTFAPRSWGPAFDPDLMVFDWESFDPSSPNYMQAKPWVAAKHGPESFYETAISTNNNVMISGATDQGSFKLGFTRNDEKGVVPNSNVKKYIINLGASYNMLKNFTASANVNFSKVTGKGRYGTGYDGGSNVNVNLRQYGQTNVDVQEQKAAYFRSKRNVTWNWADPSSPTGLYPGFYNNLYWTVYENYENDERNRVFGNIALTYDPTDWLNIMARASLDNYYEFRNERNAVGSVGVGSYSRFDQNFYESNYDLIATANKDLSDDFHLTVLLGTNIRRSRMQSIEMETSGGLVVPGLYAISNSVGTIPAPVESYQPKAVDGYFGGATLTYRGFLTLDGNIRRDRSSTLPENNHAYSYYAISGSWLFSEHLKDLTWLTSAKLRANYATVGNDAPWGSLQSVYDKPNPFGSSILFSLPDTKNNQELKPERTNSREVGLEASFFNGRIGLDASWYLTNTINQIIPVATSVATGYVSKYINAGNIQNKGIEASLHLYPIKWENFSWNIDLNFTRNRNKVLELYNDSKNLVLGSFQGGVSVNASLGQPYGTIQSNTFQFVNGERLVNANGLYATSTTTTNVIGNVNPKWIGGAYNTFRYKNVTLSFLVDVKKGGSVWSLDMYYGQMSGILPESVGVNDLGNPKRDPVEQGGGIVLPGVTADGQPNTQRVTITSNNSTVLPQSEFVYDAGYIKLREASLAYALPQKALSKLNFIKGIECSLIGRNLWLIHKNLPYADPEEALSFGNIQGYQSGAYPTTRTIGLNIKATF